MAETRGAHEGADPGAAGAGAVPEQRSPKSGEEAVTLLEDLEREFDDPGQQVGTGRCDVFWEKEFTDWSMWHQQQNGIRICLSLLNHNPEVTTRAITVSALI